MNGTILNTNAPDIATAFTIGVKPLDMQEWIQVDDSLPHYLSEKDRLEQELGDKLFMAEAGTDDSQREVLDLLAAYLPDRYPSVYRMRDGELDIIPAVRSVALGDHPAPALRRAAHLVPDDLVIMQRGPDGWRLAAASLCFPSSWSLAEKFGKPLHLVHVPVPGFGEGTRNAALIERMFDNLKVELPVWRQNWSLYRDDELYHGTRKEIHGYGHGDGIQRPYLRRERQTLRKLRVSGDILFTIQILIDPLEKIAAMEGGSETLASIAAQIVSMSDEQLSYKGMAGTREEIIEYIRSFMR